MKNLKPDLCLDTKVYIEKKAKLLGFPDDEELNGWIDTFKELADLSEQDIDFRKLDQQALELFVRTVGVSPIEATLMDKEDYLVVPDEPGPPDDVPDNNDDSSNNINIGG